MVISILLQSAVLAILLQGGFTIPAPVGLVNDFANIIPAQQIPLLEQIAEDVRSKSRGEITIVTMKDLGGLPPAEAALRIGREWKVGKIGDPGDATRNAGAVILIVPKETAADGRGQCFVATGRGTEGFITDATAGAICREAIPYFRAQDYGSGITLITFRVAERFAQEFNFTVDSTLRPVTRVAPRGGGSRGFPPQLIFLGIVVVLMLLGGGGRRGGRGGGVADVLPWIILSSAGRHRGGSWGGGGFGGGGFGGFGGGGGFSGGGGGSSW
jgi:uncharacterized protein